MAAGDGGGSLVVEASGPWPGKKQLVDWNDGRQEEAGLVGNFFNVGVNF